MQAPEMPVHAPECILIRGKSLIVDWCRIRTLKTLIIHQGKNFFEFLSKKPEDNFLVEEDDKVVGILTIGECRDDDLDTVITGEIWGIYLHPDHWGKGVGRALCEFALKQLLSRGYTQVVLWVFEGNEYARKFYEVMGFLPDGASKILEPGAPLKAIRYCRRIP